MAHAERAFGRFADHRKGLGQQFVERGTVGNALLELRRLALQLSIVERGDRRFERIDALDIARVGLEQSVITTAKNARQKTGNHRQAAFARVRWGGPGRGSKARKKAPRNNAARKREIIA
jgi:hypothetical protein